MNEERMLILKMVSEGKITAKEAESLLQTLKDIDESKRDTPQQSTSDNQQERVVELLRSGVRVLIHQIRNIKADILRKQDQYLHEQGRFLRESLRQAKCDGPQDGKAFKRIEIEMEEDAQGHHKEPPIEKTGK